MYVEDHMRESLKNHVLEQILDAEKFKAFMIRKASYDGRMMSTLIMFTPEGIVITGDLCPRAGTRGIVSDLNYGLGWFSGKLSERYLCEKFLSQEWQHEVAVTQLRAEIKDRCSRDDHGAFEDKLKAIADRLESGQLENEHDLYYELIDAGYETADGIPGYDYELADAGWLCAIQQRFVELYEAMVPAKAAE